MQYSKIILAFAAVVTSSSPALANGTRSSGSYHYSGSYKAPSTGDHTVRSYGTVVQSYRATNPNSTGNDNYSMQGNVNPYTGQSGTKPRDGEAY